MFLFFLNVPLFNLAAKKRKLFLGRKKHWGYLSPLHAQVPPMPIKVEALRYSICDYQFPNKNTASYT